MKVSILTDNIVNKRGLIAENGLSLFVEHNGARILFDTGQSFVYRHNAVKMGIDLENTDGIVLSHGHYDHCGGLVHFSENKKLPPIYMNFKAFGKRFKKDPLNNEMIDVGIPWNLSGQPFIKNSLHDNKKIVHLHPDIHILTETPVSKNPEDIPGGFYVEKAGEMVPDMFFDEQILVIETDQGLAVFMGCSHPGVCNCLDYVESSFPNQKIYTLFAGTHMIKANMARIESTTRRLLDYGIQKIVPLHCTGIEAIMEIKRVFKGRCHVLATGDAIEV